MTKGDSQEDERKKTARTACTGILETSGAQLIESPDRSRVSSTVVNMELEQSATNEEVIGTANDTLNQPRSSMPLPQPPNNLQEPPNNLQEPPNNLQEPPNNLQEPPNNLQEPPNNLQELPNNLQEPPNNLQDLAIDLVQRTNGLRTLTPRYFFSAISKLRAQTNRIMPNDRTMTFVTIGYYVLLLCLELLPIPDLFKLLPIPDLFKAQRGQNILRWLLVKGIGYAFAHLLVRGIRYAFAYLLSLRTAQRNVKFWLVLIGVIAIFMYLFVLM